MSGFIDIMWAAVGASTLIHNHSATLLTTTVGTYYSRRSFISKLHGLSDPSSITALCGLQHRYYGSIEKMNERWELRVDISLSIHIQLWFMLRVDQQRCQQQE